MNKQNDNQKICLVTGANSGIGKEIALGLAKSGAHVIMVCRDPARGKLALEAVKATSGSHTVDLLIADLSVQAEVHGLAKSIHERYTRLHVLINNAGLVLAKKTFSVDGIEMTLATNYLAPFLLTHLLLDLLEKSAPARVINISSAIHQWAKLDLDDWQYNRRKYQFMRAYAQSKLLLNIATIELARRLRGIGVSANCVHPGAVRTALGSDNANNLILKWLDKSIKYFFISPENAAKTIINLALAAQWENVSGKYFVKEQPVRASAATYNTTLAEKVWQISSKLLNLDYN